MTHAKIADGGRLAAALEGCGKGFLAVVTGAGVSLASGIPTFRGSDPDAVWTRDVTELGTNAFFRADPAGSWSWYTSRFDQVLDKSPNAAHQALAALERWHVERGGRFVLVTQNVDTLHEQAGANALIKVHGSADRVRCARHGCRNGAPSGSIARADVDMTAFFTDPVRDNVPRCPACGELLRQHVLWFDEFYDEHEDYQWSRVQAAAGAMDRVLFVGTSFQVGVTALFLQHAAERDVPVLAIDPGAAAPPTRFTTLLAQPAEVLLPDACARLGLELA